MPEYTRASITSCTPSLNVRQDRTNPTFCELLASMTKPGASPNIDARTNAIAALFVACADGNSGCGGVGSSGRQDGSPTVAPLPSRSPFAMAGCGLQEL